MPAGFRRFAIGALAVVGVLSVSAGSALAQSAAFSTKAIDGAATTTVDTAFAATERALTASFVTTAPKVDFRVQQNASQENQGVGIGVLGMITRSSVNADEDFFDLKARTGLGGGLWIGGNRNGRVGFTGEFIYLIRKSEDDFENEYSASVFEIPAVFHINFGSRSRDSIGGYVVVGPVFSFLLNQKINDVDLDDDEKFKGADIGIIGGVGVEVFRFGIEGRGNWGLRSITPDGANVESKTFTFELLGKFAFN